MSTDRERRKQRAFYLEEKERKEGREERERERGEGGKTGEGMVEVEEKGEREEDDGEERRNEDNEKKVDGREKWNVKEGGEGVSQNGPWCTVRHSGPRSSLLSCPCWSALVFSRSRRSKTAIFFLPRRICGGTKGIACVPLVPVARELRVHFHPALIVLDLVNTFPEYGWKVLLRLARGNYKRWCSEECK